MLLYRAQRKDRRTGAGSDRVSGGAGVALTTAHYYTPSGRLIQRSYADRDEYLRHWASDDDTEAAARRSWEELFLRHGQTLPDSVWTRMHGHPDGHLVAERALANLTGRSLGQAERDQRLARKVELADQQPACCGIRELVDIASASDTKVAIVSSGAQAWVTHHLDRLGLLPELELVVSGDDVLRHKPHPEPYSTALARAKADPARVVAFEDSLVGLSSATAAGLRCFLVGDFTIPKNAVRPEKADSVASFLCSEVAAQTRQIS